MYAFRLKDYLITQNIVIKGLKYIYWLPRVNNAYLFLLFSPFISK